MHEKLVMHAEATGTVHAIDPPDKRHADDNARIELRERAAGKGPVHESSSHKIGPGKVLEDQRVDIKG